MSVAAPRTATELQGADALAMLGTPAIDVWWPWPTSSTEPCAPISFRCRWRGSASVVIAVGSDSATKRNIRDMARLGSGSVPPAMW